jgi:hypothetical protein
VDDRHLRRNLQGAEDDRILFGRRFRAPCEGVIVFPASDNFADRCTGVRLAPRIEARIFTGCRNCPYSAPAWVEMLRPSACR